MSPRVFPSDQTLAAVGMRGTNLCLHLLLLQLDEGQAREIHGVCGQGEEVSS